MAFKLTIEVEPDGLVCGQCRFQSGGHCSLFEPGPRTLRDVLGYEAPHYRRLPECIEAEVYARDFMGDVQRFVERAAKEVG